jgi:hypothetical protein
MNDYTQLLAAYKHDSKNLKPFRWIGVLALLVAFFIVIGYQLSPIWGLVIGSESIVPIYPGSRVVASNWNPTVRENGELAYVVMEVEGKPENIEYEYKGMLYEHNWGRGVTCQYRDPPLLMWRPRDPSPWQGDWTADLEFQHAGGIDGGVSTIMVTVWRGFRLPSGGCPHFGD